MNAKNAENALNALYEFYNNNESRESFARACCFELPSLTLGLDATFRHLLYNLWHILLKEKRANEEGRSNEEKELIKAKKDAYDAVIREVINGFRASEYFANLK